MKDYMKGICEETKTYLSEIKEILQKVNICALEDEEQFLSDRMDEPFPYKGTQDDYDLVSDLIFKFNEIQRLLEDESNG